MPACSSANVLRTEGLDCPDSVKERELAPIPIKERERTICPDSHREQGSRMTLRAELVGRCDLIDPFTNDHSQFRSVSRKYDILPIALFQKTL